MPKDYFHLVAPILAADKYFDLSQTEIERTLNETGEFGFECDLELDDAGETAVVQVEIRIKSSGYPYCTIALLLHSTRIDGIDHEARFIDENGQKQSGWHRHIWDEQTKQAEKKKRCVPDVEDAGSLREFLIRAFQILNVTLNKHDYGLNDELRFD